MNPLDFKYSINELKKQHITFLTYNIEGLRIIYQPDVRSFLDNYDMVFFTETFASDFPRHLFPSFKIYISPAVKVSCSKTARMSGGVVMMVRKEYEKFVHPIPVECDNCVALRVSKILTGLETDCVVMGIYVPPAQSVYYAETDIDNGVYLIEYCLFDIYERYGDTPIIIMGDFNARTGNANAKDFSVPYVLFDTDDDNDNGVADKCSEAERLYSRHSKDDITNEFGRYLLKLCEQFSLVILNGLAPGDTLGDFTYIAHNGSSVVDYFLMSKSIFDCALNLRVLARVDSKHMPVEFQFSTKQLQIKAKSKHSISTSIKYIWNDDKVNEYSEAHASKEMRDMLDKATDLIEVDTNKAIDAFYEGLAFSGQCMKKTVVINSTRNNRWFDKECREKKKALRHSLRMFKKCTDKEKSDELRLIYTEKRREYKTCLKKKRAEDKNYVLETLENNMNNAKKFWGTIKSRMNSKPNASSITNDEWFNHFHSVFNNDVNANTLLPSEGNSQDEIFADDNCLAVNTTDCTSLDVEISESEVISAIGALKNGKAAGPDGFSGEFVKYSSPLVVTFLTKLFNKLFNSGTFPLSWSESIIHPLHKKGDVHSTDNYRGISLINITSKLYTYILNKRLTMWVEENNILSEAQAGFRKTYSTIDHIFTLLTLVQKQLSRSQKLYAAFIDFRKAFDLIDRNMLWIILHKNGINGKMYKAIKSMYEVVKARIRANNDVTEAFMCPHGLKQGDNCSPILFALFINELANDIMQSGKHGVTLSPDLIEMFILLFADDIVLLSTTVVGLQRQLNILHDTACRLNLTVNHDKSKIVVFRKGGHIASRERWYCGSVELEIVNQYSYLGIIFSSGLTFSYSLEQMALKAKKCIFGVLRFLWSLGENSPKLFFKIFDTQIQPVLTYGSEVWGLTADHTVIEKVHLFAIKRLLNVSIKTPNALVYCESGRYPLFIQTFTKCIRYWLKLIRMNETRIPKKAYRTLYALHCNDKNNWVSKICFTLYMYGFGYVWENQGVENVKAFISAFKQRLLDCHIQDTDSLIMTKERFQFYSTFRQLQGIPDYYIEIRNPMIRKHLTRIRLGVSQLKPHKFRYSHQERETNCSFCPGIEESEIHFILVCPRYKAIREQYIPEKYYTSPNAFRLTLLLSNHKLSLALALFISKALTRRNSE